MSQENASQSAKDSIGNTGHLSVPWKRMFVVNTVMHVANLCATITEYGFHLI